MVKRFDFVAEYLNDSDLLFDEVFLVGQEISTLLCRDKSYRDRKGGL